MGGSGQIAKKWAKSAFCGKGVISLGKEKLMIDLGSWLCVGILMDAELTGYPSDSSLIKSSQAQFQLQY